MKRLTVLLALLIFFCANSAFAAVQVDISGYWSLDFGNGKSGWLLLANNGGDGVDANHPIFSGKVVLPGIGGENKVVSNQVADYFKVGNLIGLRIVEGGALGQYTALQLNLSGGNVMPGQMVRAQPIRMDLDTFTARR